MFFRAKIDSSWNTPGSTLEAIRNVQEPGNKFAMEVDSYLLLEMSQREVTLEAKILQERSSGEHTVLYLPAHHKFFSSFNKKFKQMFEAGLFNVYLNEEKEFFIKNTTKVTEEAFKVLTMEELEAGFVVCMVPMLMAVTVFLCEWVVTTTTLVVTLCIFRAFYATRQIC